MKTWAFFRARCPKWRKLKQDSVCLSLLLAYPKLLNC